MVVWDAQDFKEMDTYQGKVRQDENPTWSSFGRALMLFWKGYATQRSLVHT